MRYMARLEKQGTATRIEFPDAPGCAVFAEEGQSVEAVAREAIQSWLEAHLVDGLAPPTPKRRAGLAIEIDPMLAFKVWLRQTRTAAGLTQAELAKRMRVSPHTIAKLEEPEYSSSIESMIKVARALGWRLVLQFEELSEPSRLQKR